jgi:ParB-like chromosome segregation protein Spo0J
MQRAELVIERIDDATPGALRFRHRLGGPSDALVASIRREGLLTPVLVLETGAGRCELVSGFKRLAACRRCAVDRIPARMAASDADPVELLGAAIRENLATDPLNEAERHLALARYVQLGAEPPWILEHAAPLLGLAGRPQVLHRAVELAALPPAVLEAADAGRIDWRHLRLLAELPPADAVAAASLLRGVRLTYQQARIVLEHLSAVAAAEGRPFADLVEAMVEWARETAATDRAAGTQLVEELDGRRHPKRTAARRRIAVATAALDLPADVEVRTDPSLEDDRVGVTIRTADAAVLVDRLQAVAGQVRQGGWDGLFGALRGGTERCQT